MICNEEDTDGRASVATDEKRIQHVLYMIFQTVCIKSGSRCEAKMSGV